MGTVVGSVSVKVNVKGDSEAFLKITELNIKNALKAMADATVQRAQMLRAGNGVPYKSGKLHSTGIVEVKENGFQTVAQFGAGLEYGRYQEFGPDGSDYKGHRTKDGRYEKKLVWDYTTPGTGPHYLETAGTSVKKEGIKNYL